MEYTYKEYASSSSFSKRYSDYQARYSDNIRESDKMLLSMIADVIPSMSGEVRLLDIGCSTGSLLHHIKNHFPDLTLHGGDLMESVIRECREQERLQGIQFDLLDIFDISQKNAFDIIVANAIFYLFEDDLLEKAIANLASALRDGGVLLVFDFFHTFKQNLSIIEKSNSHPDGLPLHFRPESLMDSILRENGFTSMEFKPFNIGVDIPLGQTFGDNSDGFEDLNSYTIKTENHDRLLFRGTLFQPWCHLTARKGPASGHK